MAETVRVKNTGLRGVTVADSKISFIDGEKGVLIYRGFRIEDLADNSSFLETAFLLMNGSLPSNMELDRFSDRIKQNRALPDFVIQSMKTWPVTAGPMDVLQAGVALLAAADPRPDSSARPDFEDKAAGLIARLPSLVAAWHRIRNGLEPLPPDNDLDHAANLLWMLHGELPDAETARDLDVCLVLHADHTFNASTFACREVVSTRAHLYAGVVAGLGALSGSLHGGANRQVMNMLLELENEKDVAGWVINRLEQGERIMGLGHAIYKTGDPRAVYLKNMGERLARKTGQPWFDLSRRIEETALAEFSKRGKTTILPNLDFNSAPVYYMLGIPIDLMTPMFAVSRVAGWCSHIIEEVFAEAQEKPALYRPTAEYVGDYCGLTGCVYQDMSSRQK